MGRALRIGHALTSYDTQFPGTENPLSQASRWRVGGVTGFYKNPRTTPAKCFAANFVGAGFDDCLAHLQNHAIPSNHFSEFTISREDGYEAGDTHECSLYVRMSIGEEFVRGYEVIFEASTGSIQVVLWKGISQEADNFDTGISVTGSSPGASQQGDVLRVVAVGDQFAVYKNSVQFASFSDDTWAQGNPGIGFFVRDTDTVPESYCISRFRAGAAS